MMKATIIVNPISGRHNGNAAAMAAQRILSAAGWEIDTKVTCCPGEAETLARQLIDTKPDMLIACGGDGTITQVISALAGTDIPTAIIPAGTGNDLCRTLGIPINPSAAAEGILNGRKAYIDLLSINNGQFHSVNITSLGFDAMVADRINRRYRLLGGRMAYLTAVFQEMIRLRATQVTVEVDGHMWQGKALLAAVANARCYGGGMQIAPAAKVDDGLADVVIVEYVGRMEFLMNLTRVIRGCHLQHPKVHFWQGQHVTITTESVVPVLADGDIICKTPLEVKVLPHRAPMWLPQTSIEMMEG